MISEKDLYPKETIMNKIKGKGYTQSQMEQIDKCFDYYDQNKDGALDNDELKKLLEYINCQILIKSS